MGDVAPQTQSEKEAPEARQDGSCAIEITPEMMEAGVSMLWDYDRDWSDSNIALCRILEAVLRQGHYRSRAVGWEESEILRGYQKYIEPPGSDGE